MANNLFLLQGFQIDYLAQPALTEFMSECFTGGKAARAHNLLRAEVKNEWSSSSATPYAFMLWTRTVLPLTIFKNVFVIVGLEIR